MCCNLKSVYCSLGRFSELVSSPTGILNGIDLNLEGKKVSYNFQKLMNFKSAKWENSTFRGVDFKFFKNFYALV